MEPHVRHCIFARREVFVKARYDLFTVLASYVVTANDLRVFLEPDEGLSKCKIGVREADCLSIHIVLLKNFAYSPFPFLQIYCSSGPVHIVSGAFARDDTRHDHRNELQLRL